MLKTNMADDVASDAHSEAIILHILVIGFHHQKGSTVEFAYPPLVGSSATQSFTSSLPPVWSRLPHLALPDGCHNYEEDSVFFTLPKPSDPSQCVYGVACSRQVDTRDLPRISKEITRSTIQKSVCVISLLPIFGFIEAKLNLVTHAYFNSKDFSDISILIDAYQNLNVSVSPLTAAKVIEIGLSQQDLVRGYQHRLLQIFKALLLQKKVMVFGTPARTLCNCVLSISALFPLTSEGMGPLKGETDEYGFPLAVFQSGSLQPYMCLQQMDLITDRNSSWLLAGVVNPLFEKQKMRVCDVFVDMTRGFVAVHDPALRSVLRLTTADLRFCSLLTDEIHEKHEELPQQWLGSNEWVQAQFKHYLLSLLATSYAKDPLSLDDFNQEFVDVWLSGPVYKTWRKTKHHGIAKVEPRHVCEGELSMSDLKRRLVAQASDYGLLSVHQKEQVAHAVQKTQRMVSETAEKVSSAVSSMWSSASTAVYSWWSGDSKQRESDDSHVHKE